MLYTIVNDQPFQVLSDSFTISPSESGYELYLSADGVNYSQFITVPSGVTKQMVDMNNGNFYRLMGNTSIVTVNWSRDCCGGGSGSGAGVSSLNGQTGALTTKTINGNDILGSGDITIEGGSGAKTYVLNLMTNDERIALLNEISSTYPSGSYDTISSGFPVSDYQFYYYIEGYGDDGNGFIPLRITTVSPQIVVRFEGILNGYAARTFKELTLECTFNGNITVRKNAVYNLPKASSSTLGGVKIGSGINVADDGTISVEGGDGIYYVDGDNINNYSGVVDEIYHKLSSGETAYAAVKYDYAKYPVAKAEIYEYQEGQPGGSDYLRREGFQIIATRFGSDGYAIRSGIINVFRYEGRDGNGYSCGQGWDYNLTSTNTVSLSQSDYDALVQAGTVDANTLYVII